MSTCVRPQGSSIVDLTWATPPVAASVRSWRVLAELYPYTDHRVIEIILGNTPAQVQECRLPRPQRWSLRALDEDRFEGAILAGTWTQDGEGDPEAEAANLRDVVVRTCDVAMPRVNPRPRRAAYWWSDEIASLRRAAWQRTRRLKRASRARPADPARIRAAATALREARHALRRAIAVAKTRAWEEFVLTLNEDPWGRPYKAVMNKLRRWASPYTESLDPVLRDRILTSLFPVDGGGEGGLVRTTSGGVVGRLGGD